MRRVLVGLLNFEETAKKRQLLLTPSKKSVSYITADIQIYKPEDAITNIFLQYIKKDCS